MNFFRKKNTVTYSKNHLEKASFLIKSADLYAVESYGLLLGKFPKVKVVADSNLLTSWDYFRMRNFLPELQDAINAKNQKIDEYLKNCDECWLLVVADRSKADQGYYLTPEIKSHRFESKFKKTFFLEIAERELLELTTI